MENSPLLTSCHIPNVPTGSKTHLLMAPGTTCNSVPQPSYSGEPLVWLIVNTFFSVTHRLELNLCNKVLTRTEMPHPFGTLGAGDSLVPIPPCLKLSTHTTLYAQRVKLRTQLCAKYHMQRISMWKLTRNLVLHSTNHALQGHDSCVVLPEQVFWPCSKAP